MKRSRFFLITTLFFVLASNAQIDKSNWMMGGDVSFKNSKYITRGISQESTSFVVHPSIGYFIIDKLALGTTIELGFGNRTNTNYGIAPFVRYYFLEKEKQINLFSELSYGIFAFNNSDFRSESLNIKAGTVFFLNSSVGLEVAINYANKKDNTDIQTKDIYLGIGFQIHLEREK
jgi:hypothetical protein